VFRIVQQRFCRGVGAHPGDRRGSWASWRLERSGPFPTVRAGVVRDKERLKIMRRQQKELLRQQEQSQ
jgi:hypothetical protein